MKSLRGGLLSVVVVSIAWPLSAQQRLEPPNPLEPRPTNPLIREGDLHYGRRQEKRAGAVADRTEVAAAIRAYDTASEAPDSAEARWKLARALIFQGLYTDLEPSAQLAVFEKARAVSEAGLGILERRAKHNGGGDFSTSSDEAIAESTRKDPDALPCFYWAAVSWGQWALARGKEEANRLGAADKIRKYASVVIAIDPGFEDGGGYRVLGRLHDQAPRMTLETQWASREQALRYLRLAVHTNAANFANRLFLAEALASGSPSERSEATTILRRLVAEAPSPNRLVEDLRTQEAAQRDLAARKES